MNICEPFIRRPIATSLLAVALFLVGAVAYVFLPVARLPNVEFPTIHVRASQPGADPETMAATVAAPLERRLGEIAGITEMTSYSSLGTTSITVQFELGRSIDAAARDVQAAINAAMTDLPGDLPSQPAFWKSNPAASPVMILALTSDTMTPGALYDAADTVVDQRLSQVPGVAEVRISGAEQPAIRVRVRPDALASLGIGLDQVRTAITDATRVDPLGAIEGPTQAAAIATNGQLTQPKDYEPIVVKTGSGTIVRLGQIASIEEGVRNRFNAGWLDDRPAILLIIQKEADANAIAVADRIKALLPQLGRWIPAGVEVHILSDRTISIRASVHELQLTLAASIGLVMLVVLLFLRRVVPTLAAGITVPLSLAGTVAVMWLRGLQPRQSILDGAHRVGGLRRRRRDRHDRERAPQPRGGPQALRRHARGCKADRLHGRLDHALARRRLHPDPADGRHPGPAAARVLAHPGLRRPHLGRDLALGHADDLRALDQAVAAPARDAASTAGSSRRSRP